MEQSVRGEGISTPVVFTVLLPLLAFVAAHRGQRVLRRGGVLAGHGRPGGDRPAGAGRRPRRPARSARRCGELSFQLSGAQLGITITALLTGYLAEPALAQLFGPLLGRSAARPTAWPTLLALALATLFSMLFGELVPKNAALARPMRAALATAGPMRGLLHGRSAG